MSMLRVLQRVLALCSIILGLLVMMGWVLRSPMLVQIHPSFVPMQFNTALGFLMIGISLLCIIQSRKRASVLSASIATTLGVLTVIQYAFAVDLGIDQLFIRPTIGVDPNIPGRIGANTAFCFSIVGITIFLAQVTHLKRCWLGMVGGIVLVLSIASLWGYISDMPGLSGWGEFLSGMAVHTAVGFLLVGASLYLLRFDDVSEPKAGTADRDLLITPVTVAVPIMVLSICVWQAMESWERMKLRAFTEESTQTVADYLDGELIERFSALQRMGQRWSTNNGTERFAWEADAGNYVDDYPGVQAVEWVDRTNHVCWVVPMEGNEEVVGLYSTFDSFRKDAQHVAIEDHTTRATRTIKLIQGGLGFLVYVPITAYDERDGFMLGVFRSDTFLENAFRFADFGHEILVQDNQVVVFSTQRDIDLNEYKTGFAAVTTAGIHWDVRLRPTEKLIASYASAWPEAILFIGLIVACIVGLLVRMLDVSSAIRARQQQLLEEIKQKQIEIEEKNRDLSRSNTEMEEFTYTVSHDLKSPLVTIEGYTGFLKLDLKNKKYDRVEHFADRIGAATQRMSETISDLLELSRVGRGKHEIQPINTREVIREVVSMLDSQIQSTNTLVIVEDNIPDIQADRVRTLQIFQNLIANGIHYAQQDGKQCEIRVGGTVQGGSVLLFVADNGPGIKSEFHEKIFGLFQRISTDVQGTGVGLAIVARIAATHGGQAWVESQHGAGATFFVTMPIAEQAVSKLLNAA